MVDFGGLVGKAQDLIAEHSEQVKQGIDKVGAMLGDRVGQDKVDGVEQKLSGLVDKIAGAHRSPGDVTPGPVAGETPVPPAAPATDPIDRP